MPGVSAGPRRGRRHGGPCGGTSTTRSTSTTCRRHHRVAYPSRHGGVNARSSSTSGRVVQSGLPVEGRLAQEYSAPEQASGFDDALYAMQRRGLRQRAHTGIPGGDSTARVRGQPVNGGALHDAAIGTGRAGHATNVPGCSALPAGPALLTTNRYPSPCTVSRNCGCAGWARSSVAARRRARRPCASTASRCSPTLRSATGRAR